MALPRGIGYLIAFCVVLSAPAAAQAAPSPTDQAQFTASSPRPRVAAPAAAASTADVRELQTALKADIAAVRPTWWERLIPAVIGLVGVLVGGLLGWLQQRRQLALTAKMQQQQLQENERIGRAKAGFESLSKVIDFQAKQVNEFYSPLRLMLRRSSGVRRQLTDQLKEKDPARYTYVHDEADGRDHLFVVGADGAKTRFRLIEHMHELATSHSELMPLVREIVNIGVAMTTLIDAKGGMAINESDRLTTLLGRYLAHFSILRDFTEKADKNPSLLAALRYNVAYPNELDSALQEDMTSLTDQIEAWKRLSRQMWDEASNPLASH